MTKKFEIHPKRPISGILPNQRRIDTVIQLPLSEKEFLRCMNNATLYAVVGSDRVLVTELDYNKALELFDKHVEYVTKTVKLSGDFDQDLKIDWKTNTLVKDKVETEPKFDKLDKPVEIPSTGIVLDKIINKDEAEKDPDEVSAKPEETSTTQEKAPRNESSISTRPNGKRRR